ncbi:MAG: molybdopterin molybdenumtransferase MoeA [Candidatus Hydrogenedentota bacterium]|nr:MAG: molybdopterin molybdenumtransferase MoeA [Candidatus Hydrogenedentota bacterium]
MISYSDALKNIEDLNLPSRKGLVSLEQAYGLSLAKTCIASRDFPPFDRVTMDGYAVSSNVFNNLKEKKLRKTGTLLAGDEPKNYPVNECLHIMTGASLPEEYDAVIAVERTEEKDGFIFFHEDSVKPGNNIASKGEDHKKGSILLEEETVIRQGELGILASNGQKEVEVYLPPKTALITTGNEVKDPGEEIKPPEIYNANRYILYALLQEFKIDPEILHLRDDVQAIEKVSSLDANLFIFTGGVSMGVADFIHSTLPKLGVETVFHKVAIKPGKPVYLGISQDKKVFLGLPGNPLSAQTAFLLFGYPILRKIMRLNEIASFSMPIENEISHKKSKTVQIPREEFWPCRINKNSKLEKLPINGSGDIRTSAFSHGLAHIPAGEKSLPAGTFVLFYPWRRL